MGRHAGGKKTGGRKPGSKNKMALPLKEFILKLLTDNQGQIERDFKKLDAVERMRMVDRLSRYIIPTHHASKTELDIVDTCTDDQLLYMVEQIKKGLS